uniref:Uncharacterized protein n=1 Tax=Anguilla anguilla TaxID=7936 RepID=A0A0E9U0Q5_ANGAN
MNNYFCPPTFSGSSALPFL